MNKQEFVKREKYLKLNEEQDFVIDYNEKLDIIDFHTHMSNVLPLKVIDPKATKSRVSYKTLPQIDNLDLSVPYWTKINHDEKRKGLGAFIKYSMEGYNIFKDMTQGGTYNNCFKSQEENMIRKSVVLPISTKKYDRSIEALKVAEEYPEKFIPFCSVHPSDPEMRQKIFQYRDLGAKGLKLKISNMEMKGDFQPLIKLFKACHEAGLPVLLHTGSLTHIKKENTSKLMWNLLRTTRVELFGELLKELPKDFKFVFGHSGVAEYELVAEYMKKFPSTYAEVSTQSADSIQYLIDHVGHERILFGSDWPALPQALTLSRVLIATEDDKKARDHILCKNAEKLLDI